MTTAYCPIPDVVLGASQSETPAELTVGTPTPTGEICDTSVTTSIETGGSGSTSTTTETGGPPGAPGPIGPEGPKTEHDGVQWKGEWKIATDYKKNVTGTPYHADVVRIDGSLFVCIEDHTSDDFNRPRQSTYKDITTWPEKWELMVENLAVDAGFSLSLGDIVNGAFDWMQNATIGDWAKAIAIGAGVAWAGSKIIDAMTGDGSSPTVDSRYNGSPSYTGAYTPPTLRSVCQSLCIEAGILNYDVSLLSNTISCHFALSQQTSVRTVLDNLSRAFQFDMVDSSGILKFVPRNSTSIRTLTHDDMGFNSSNAIATPITMKRLQSVDLPRSVSLTYIAEDLDYNNYTQRSEISTFVAGNDINLSVPFMLTHADAKEATDKLLVGAHLERMQYVFKTTYQNAIDLEPGDVISIPEGMVRIVQMEEVEDAILEIQCVDAGAPGEPTPIVVGGVTIGTTASTYTGTGLDPQLPPVVLNTATTVTETGTLFVDLPTISSDDTSPRASIIIHGYDNTDWKGAQIFKSVDDGASYSLIGQQNYASTFGMVSAITPYAQSYFWDNNTTIDVVVKTGTLLSKTDTAVLAGENLCMVGQECIAFGVATLIAANTYRLSHLLRGRKGTEFATSTHVVNELFVLLDSLFTITVSEADRGKTLKYKVVTIGSDLTKVAAQDLQVLGNNLVPWTPAKVTAARVAHNWDINWIERPRFANGLTDYTEISHDDDWGGYGVIIYNGINVVRQTIIYTPTFQYTVNMQVADFGAEINSIKVGVCQISKKYGGGRQIIVNI